MDDYMKRCSKCGEIKPLTNEYFDKMKTSKDGFRGQCRICRKEYQKQYYNENKDINKEYYEEYYKENKKDIMEYQKRYYKDNKEYYKQYHKDNKDMRRQNKQRQRSRNNNLSSTLTIKQWGVIMQDFNHSCAYCGMSEKNHLKQWGERLHQEHFVPLSNGGGYEIGNIIPSCKVCNGGKGNMDFFEWYPNYKYFDENRMKFILKYLGCDSVEIA